METEFTITNSPVIYVWKCIPEGKFYIGQTIDAQRRHDEFIKWDKPYSGPKINEMREQYPSLEFWDYEILIELPCDDEVNDKLNDLETSAILVYMEEYGIDNVLNMSSGGGVLRMFNGSKEEYGKYYYQKNKECIKKRQKEYEKTDKRKQYYKEREKSDKRKQYRKDYHQKNKEHINERSREWYDKNKERIKEYNKHYNDEHKEEINAKKKRFREKHKEEIKARNKQYREKHKEEIKAYREKHKEEMKAYQRAYRARKKQQRNDK